MDAEMMSSKLQGQWLIWMAQWIAPKRGMYLSDCKSKASFHEDIHVGLKIAESLINIYT